MSSNYPAGVTNDHPIFNPSETTLELACETEEAQVVPVHAIREGLSELLALTGHAANMPEIEKRLAVLQQQVIDLERTAEYECPFDEEVEVAVAEDAEWTCPICGATHTVDSLPEGPDPDRGWDERHGN